MYKILLNIFISSNGYGYAVYETSIWGGGTQNMIFGTNIRDRALIFVDAKDRNLSSL